MKGASAVLALSLCAQGVAAQEIVRHPIPGSDFPISRAVEIPAGTAMVHLSGAVPVLPEGTGDAVPTGDYGDTQVQTVSVLRSIEATLGDLGLSMGDVVKMQVFLVAPEGDDAMDFGGFMAGYTQFFGVAGDSRLPVRTVVEVSGLADPRWLVEIEVAAARPPEE